MELNKIKYLEDAKLKDLKKNNFKENKIDPLQLFNKADETPINNKIINNNIDNTKFILPLNNKPTEKKNKRITDNYLFHVNMRSSSILNDNTNNAYSEKNTEFKTQLNSYLNLSNDNSNLGLLKNNDYLQLENSYLNETNKKQQKMNIYNKKADNSLLNKNITYNPIKNTPNNSFNISTNYFNFANIKSFYSKKNNSLQTPSYEKRFDKLAKTHNHLSVNKRSANNLVSPKYSSDNSVNTENKMNPNKYTMTESLMMEQRSFYSRSYQERIFWTREKMEEVRKKLKIASKLVKEKARKDFDEIYHLINQGDLKVL